MGTEQANAPDSSAPDAAERTVGLFLDSLPFSRYHVGIVVVLGLVGMLEAYDTALTGSLAVSVGKEFNLAPYKELFIIAPTVGLIISLFVTSVFISDRVSRKRIVFIGITWSSLFTLLTAFAPNAPLLVLSRFVSGFGYGMTLPACYPLAAELVPPKHRATFGSAYEVLLGLSFVMTSVVGILVEGVHGGWRIIPFIGGVFLVVLPPLVKYVVPESPRWLVSAHRYEEANLVLRRFGQRSGRPLAQVPVLHAAAVDDERTDGYSEASGTSRFQQLFAPEIIRGTALAIIAWTCSLVPYYIFSTLLPSVLESRGYEIVASLGFSALIFAVSIPGKIFNGYAMERFGRGPTIVVSLLASVIGLLITIFINSIPGIIVGEVIIGLSVLSAFPAIRTFMTEQFPTRLRGRGYFFSEWVGRLIAGIPIPFLLAGHLNNPNLIFGVVIGFVVIGAIGTAVLGTDTRGRLELVADSRRSVPDALDTDTPQQR